MAGVAASVLDAPFDVIRTRLQVRPELKILSVMIISTARKYIYMI